MKVLLEVEAQTLAEGREWTRQRLEERLQAQADQNRGALSTKRPSVEICAHA
jgi:hypothetical protein